MLRGGACSTREGHTHFSHAHSTIDTALLLPRRVRTSSLVPIDINKASGGRPDPRASTWAFMVTQVIDINMALGLIRTPDPLKALVAAWTTSLTWSLVVTYATHIGSFGGFWPPSGHRALRAALAWVRFVSFEDLSEHPWAPRHFSSGFSSRF